MILRRFFYLLLLIGVLTGLLLSQSGCTLSSRGTQSPSTAKVPAPTSSAPLRTATPLPVAPSHFAVVDPNYIYQQLLYMATHFLHREAGFDTNLPPNVNGHDEFAAYWTRTMLGTMHSFGAQVYVDHFPTGWRGRDGVAPGANVEVTIPGATSPQQVVVIGCHYDAMANSTQSAYDDTSGCAIELGVAQALATFWHSQQAYPARTLRFVLFDGEEQNLLGSVHYVNSTINGNLSNVVAMFDEEQNGLGYPARFLGQLSNPFMPLYINVTPSQSNDLYSSINNLPPAQLANIVHFRALLQQSIPAVFQEFRALTYYGLTYHTGKGQDVPQAIFTPKQVSNAQVVDDTDGGSDEVAFTEAGIPSTTLVTDASYYDDNPSPWAFPNDQPQDTVQLMNTYGTGGSNQSYAVTLSLALSGMITTWMLNQPDILGKISLHQLPTGPIAAISDISDPQVGTPLSLNASASFDPRASESQLSYHWNFGDEQQASRMAVTHTYTRTGQYTITLTVTSPGGTRTVQDTLNIVQQPTTYPNQYDRPARDTNEPNTDVTLPTPNDSLHDRIIHTPLRF